MPRKLMFSREEVIGAALELVREGGMAKLTARSLGEKLGSSSRPVFSLFEGMEEVQRAVLAAAGKRFQESMQREMESGAYPPYKASGMAYIRFAREEKELFRLLFMRNRSHEEIPDGRQELGALLGLLEKSLGLSEEEALLFHLEMWVYVHGIAAMVATDYLEWDTALVSGMLTDAYRGLVCRWKQKSEKPETNGGMDA